VTDNQDLLNHPERICETDRHREICRLEAYFKGTQYDGRPDWWTGYHANQCEGDRVPLRERKPCVIYALPKTSVNQAVRFTIGEGRFPTVTVDEIEPDEAVVPGLTVSEDEAKVLTDYIARLIDNSQIKTAMRSIMRQALSQRTAVGVVTIKRGSFVIDTPRAQDCSASFRDDDPSADVAELRWCFPFQKPVSEHGRTVTKTFFYRRDVTPDRFISYDDALCEGAKEIVWVESETQARPHAFGFCPVAWMRNLPESYCGSIDGTSLYDGLEDEFDALNFTLSQRHRGIHYYGTPQAYETGVQGDDKQPGGVGRTARTGAQEGAPSLTADPASGMRGSMYGRDKVSAGPFGVNTKAARKISPDSIWSYQGEEVTLGLIETSGKAFEVATKHVDDIRGRLLETMSVVIADAATLQKTDLSGVALAKLFSPLLALVDELREHWWTHGIHTLLSMMLRITAVTKGEGIFIPGAKAAAEILSRFQYVHEGGVSWIPPRMTPTWGDYFSASNAEIKTAVETASLAKEKGLVKPETATQFIADYFGVMDADDESESANEDATTSADALKEAQAELDAAKPAIDAETAAQRDETAVTESDYA
jgi:hypothetical protein